MQAMLKDTLLPRRLLPVLLVPVFVATSRALTFSDDFNDNWLDGNIWSENSIGSGHEVREINQRLELSLAANSVGDPLLGETMAASILSEFLLVGNFDVQIDFKLVDWPLDNRAHFGIGLSPGPASVQIQGRGQYSGVYGTHFDDGVSEIATDQREGGFRLIRMGNLISGFYMDPLSLFGGWAHIGTGLGPAGPTKLAISLWGHDSDFRDQNVKVFVDNLLVSAVEIRDLNPTPISESGDAILLLGGVMSLFCMMRAAAGTREGSMAIVISDGPNDEIAQ